MTSRLRPGDNPSPSAFAPLRAVRRGRPPFLPVLPTGLLLSRTCPTFRSARPRKAVNTLSGIGSPQWGHVICALIILHRVG